MVRAANVLASDVIEAKAESQSTHWTFSYRGKPLMTYAFAPQQFKPYIKSLSTIHGKNILRDAPSDHLHHHALMYGIRVNGINFWEETAGSGVQKPIRTDAPQIRQTASGSPEAMITQAIHWLAPEDAFLPNTNAPALLVEQRTLGLNVNEEREEVAVCWESQFKVGTKSNVVVLTGANYHGLGMRFLRELDPVASHLAPKGELDLPGNRQDVSSHAWEAVLFRAEREPITVVLFGDRKNARGDSRFFAMKAPFAYLSATQGLDQEPLVYRRGDEFRLSYVVAVYPGLKTAGELSQLASTWSSSQ